MNHDDLFGEIEFDLYWSGKTSIVMFGKKHEIILSIDGEEDANFSPIQREAYTNFMTNMGEITNAVELGIQKYYEENVEEYRDIEEIGYEAVMLALEETIPEIAKSFQ